MDYELLFVMTSKLFCNIVVEHFYVIFMNAENLDGHIWNFVAFLVVAGTALSTVSCISSVYSSPNQLVLTSRALISKIHCGLSANQKS